MQKAQAKENFEKVNKFNARQAKHSKNSRKAKALIAKEVKTKEMLPCTFSPNCADTADYRLYK